MIMKKAIKALIWSLVGQIGSSGISTIFILVFARFMPPAEFGVFAAGAMVTNLASMLAGLGLATALVQQKQFDTTTISTAFWLATAAAAVFAVAAVALAGPIALLFQDPRIHGIMLPLAITMIVSNGTAILTTVLRRDLDLRALSLRAFVVNLAAGLIATPLVMTGHGAAALVTQSVANAVLSLIATIVLLGWRVRLRFDRDAAKEMLQYSIPVMKSDFLNIANLESPKLFIGVLLGSDALGLYSMANRLLNLLLQVFGTPLSSVAFPLLSEVYRNEPKQVGKLYIRILKLTAVTILPVFLVFSSFGVDIVTLFFGPNWEGAGFLSVWMSLSGILLVLGYVNGATIMAIGYPQQRYRYILAGVLVGTILLAAMTPLGLAWVGVALLLRALFTEVLLTRGVLRLLGMAFPNAVSSLMPQAIAGIALVTTAVAVQLEFTGASALFSVAFGGTAALGSYVVSTWILDRGVFAQLSCLFRKQVAE
ncbi:MAG: hypothetical protein A3D16_18535 [Rhodobacterales bacterium RIFCSPHIGHO2_02_FULL_62_130]|nr:MAG: hypothetical protein A3D16_18535 [Rhodobacterales bacterium RIFCSPHIGHO2_02_FULL_62_130]OHC60306.1 MAG: hypothetical protein A3E48_18560 [Rhodobacterales bacterium RIFCSPHIGHO2_12_FULL_62_75]HCZ01550.1 hypothetical protein [Rhodobacter sp.]